MANDPTMFRSPPLPTVTYVGPDVRLIEALAYLVEASKGTKAEDAVAEFAARMTSPSFISLG